MPGGARLSIVSLLLALTGCSLLVDTDVGVRDGGMAGKPDGGSGRAECGTISRLQDGFNGTALDGMWLSGQVGSHIDPPALAGGHLRIAFRAGVLAEDVESSVAFSHYAYDLRGDSVAVRVDSVDPVWRSSLAIGEPGVDRPQIGIGTEGSSLTAWTLDPPSEPVVFETRRYDPSTDRYWRIRESDGAVELETAGDDRVFAPFARLDDPAFPLDNVYAALAVVSGGASDQDGAIEFDELNQGAEATPACPIADLADSFDPPVPGRLWIDRSVECTVEAGDGTLVGNAPAGTYCDVASAKAYSIEAGGSLAVEIAAFPTAAGSSVELHLADADGNRVWIRRRDGVLRAELDVGDSTVDDFEMATIVSDGWWRIRESGGDLVVETAPDGIAWDPQKTFHASGAIDLAQVRAILVVAADAEPASAEIGGVNQTP
jgi:hypothetical protein